MDGACVINLDEYKYIPQETKNSIGDKNITINIYRIQANNWIICGYFCIGFIDFMLEGKN